MKHGRGHDQNAVIPEAHGRHQPHRPGYWIASVLAEESRGKHSCSPRRRVSPASTTPPRTESPPRRGRPRVAERGSAYRARTPPGRARDTHLAGASRAAPGRRDGHHPVPRHRLCSRTACEHSPRRPGETPGCHGRSRRSESGSGPAQPQRRGPQRARLLRRGRPEPAGRGVRQPGRARAPRPTRTSGAVALHDPAPRPRRAGSGRDHGRLRRRTRDRLTRRLAHWWDPEDEGIGTSLARLIENIHRSSNAVAAARYRTRAEIEALFDGLELLPPTAEPRAVAPLVAGRRRERRPAADLPTRARRTRAQALVRSELGPARPSLRISGSRERRSSGGAERSRARERPPERG